MTSSAHALSSVLAANRGINPSALNRGQRVVIPGSSTAAPAPATAAPPAKPAPKPAARPATRVPAAKPDPFAAAGLAAACRASRRRGFRGRIAIHPDQVAVINSAYSPTEAELAHAQRIVDAFAAQPDAGALSIDGQMIDKPHLTQALRTLAAAD